MSPSQAGEKDGESESDSQHISVTHPSLIWLETGGEEEMECVWVKQRKERRMEEVETGALIHFDDMGCFPVDLRAVTL